MKLKLFAEYLCILIEVWSCTNVSYLFFIFSPCSGLLFVITVYCMTTKKRKIPCAWTLWRGSHYCCCASSQFQEFILLQMFEQNFYQRVQSWKTLRFQYYCCVEWCILKVFFPPLSWCTLKDMSAYHTHSTSLTSLF